MGNQTGNQGKKNKNPNPSQTSFVEPTSTVKQKVNAKEAPSREDWEGGASRPEDEGQKVTRDEDKFERNMQSIPTQNTHEIDADQEIDEDSDSSKAPQKRRTA